MTVNIKKEAYCFIKQYNIDQLSFESLKKVLTQQGYILVEYNGIYNDETVTSLLHSLNLQDMVSQSRGFSYSDKNHRIVFVNEDLSDEEKLVVLAHEEGHIYLNHMASLCCIGHDVKQEHDANEFAHYLLHQNIHQIVSRFLKKHKKICITAACIILVGLIGLTGISVYNRNQSYYGEYYITSSGQSYHRKDCIFVKNKTNVSRLTKEQYDSGEYDPCEICLPQG